MRSCPDNMVKCLELSAVSRIENDTLMYNNANDVLFPAVSQKLALLLSCLMCHTDSGSRSDPSSIHL